jgi:hypothetical protein
VEKSGLTFHSIKYRSREGDFTLWAKQMPAAFAIRLKKGLIDQRKAGAKARVQFVQMLKGDAGDYLVLIDTQSGDRTVWTRETFDKHSQGRASGRRWPIRFWRRSS